MVILSRSLFADFFGNGTLGEAIAKTETMRTQVRVMESIRSMLTYHLGFNHNTEALCGERVIPTRVQRSQWGQAPHKWCDACPTLEERIK